MRMSDFIVFNGIKCHFQLKDLDAVTNAKPVFRTHPQNGELEFLKVNDTVLAKSLEGYDIFEMTSPEDTKATPLNTVLKDMSLTQAVEHFRQLMVSQGL